MYGSRILPSELSATSISSHHLVGWLSCRLLAICLLWSCSSVMLPSFFPHGGLVLPRAHAVPREATHVNDRHGFSISYPSSLFAEQITPPDSAIALVLAGKNGFPTFTVSVLNGGYQPLSSEAHVDQVVREYQRAGFSDARAVRVAPFIHRGVALKSPLVTILFSTPPEAIVQRCQGGRGRGLDSDQFSVAEETNLNEDGGDELSLTQASRAARFFVRRSQDGERCTEDADRKQWLIRSKVLLISTPSRHYVLTYLDFADRGNFEQAPELFNRFRVGVDEGVEGNVQDERIKRKGEEAAREDYGGVRGVVSWIVPAITGLVESTDERVPDRTDSSHSWVSNQGERIERDERGDETAEVLARPRLAEFARGIIPNSQGGKLFGVLTLFASGVVMNRFRRR